MSFVLPWWVPTDEVYLSFCGKWEQRCAELSRAVSGFTNVGTHHLSEQTRLNAVASCHDYIILWCFESCKTVQQYVKEVLYWPIHAIILLSIDKLRTDKGYALCVRCRPCLLITGSIIISFLGFLVFRKNH